MNIILNSTIKMRFCSFCENMLYVSVQDTSDSKKLVHYCKNCSHKLDHERDGQTIGVLNQTFDADNNNDQEFIMSVNYSNDTRSYKQYMNKNIKYDPTLPHVNNIKCIDQECLRKHPNTDTIYIKYDHMNMKYLYFCCNCENFWKL